MTAVLGCRAHRKWARLTALVLLCGCGPGTDTRGGAVSSADFVERDSAGIAIAVTPGQTAHAPLGWEVSTVPDLEIGVTAAQSSGDSFQAPVYEFHQIGGVRQLADGRVVILDGGSREVRYFDSRGRFLERVGRRGEGPGEFVGGPFLVPAFDNDSLLLFDTHLVRFQFLSFDGTGYRVIRPNDWKGARRPPLGFIDSKVLVEGGVVRQTTTTGADEQPMTFAWTDMISGNQTLVDSFTVRAGYCVVSDGRPPFCNRIPFNSTPAAAVWGTGALITEGVASEIRENDLEGQLRRIIRIDEPLRRVTDADVRRYVELRKGPIQPGTPIPETMPTFQSLLVDDEGWLWAQVYEWDPVLAANWIVFDTNGRAHGSVETPAGLDIRQVGRDFILGVWRDELDVEHVRRYRLDRRPQGTNDV